MIQLESRKLIECLIQSSHMAVIYKFLVLNFCRLGSQKSFELSQKSIPFILVHAKTRRHIASHIRVQFLDH